MYINRLTPERGPPIKSSVPVAPLAPLAPRASGTSGASGTGRLPSPIPDTLNKYIVACIDIHIYIYIYMLRR